MGLFPINPYEVSDQTMGEPDPDQCQLGISPRCTEEGAYEWHGTYVCAHCLTSAQKAMAETFPISEIEQVRR